MDKLGLFLEKFCDMIGLDVVLLMNIGIEVVEIVFKVVCCWGYMVKGILENKVEIIVVENNFYGCSILVISFLIDIDYQKGFGLFILGFKVVFFNDVKVLEEVIIENICVFLVEFVQGEVGINVLDDGYLKEVCVICDKYNVLMFLDEI